MKRIAFKGLILQGMIILMSIICTVPVFAKGGDTIWAKGDLLAHRQEATVSAVDGNGNVIVAGYQNLTNNITDDDFWTVKFNADGTIAWHAAYNRVGGSDQIIALAVDSANDVIVTGYTWNGINNDIHTIKYSGTDGTVLWQDTYQGSANGKDIATSLVVDNANNLIYVGGYTQNSSGGEDFLLLQYENKATAPSNAPLRVITHPGPDGGRNYINSVALCTGGIAVTGSSWNGTDYDFLTIKYTSDGTESWEKRYTSSGSNPDIGRYVKCDQAGNVIVTGTSSNTLDYDIHTVKYQATDGVPLWQATHNGAFDDEPAGLSVDNSGDIYITGYTWTLAGYNDIYTVKYNGTTGGKIWDHLFDSGKGADLATATGIVVDNAPDGDVFVTGYTITSGNYDFQTLKYKKDSGHLLWQRSFNGATGLSDRTIGIGLAPDGNVIVSGWSDKSAQQDGGTFTATGGSKSTVINTAKSWAVDQWKDYFVYLSSGIHTGDYRKIQSNTANTLTLAVDFTDPVTAGTGYYIYDKDDYDLYVIKYDKGILNPPTNLAANTISKGEDGKYTVRLTWEDNSGNETGFRIERKLGDQSAWSSATTFTVGANVTSIEDSGLSANDYYYYRVVAYNATDETYPSNEAHTLTFLVTYLNPIWSKITDGGYSLQDVPTAIASGPDNNPVVTGFSDSGESLGTFDYYTVKYNSSTGDPIWTNRYNSMQDEIDQAKCLSIDSNNDVVVSGQSSLFSQAAQANINSVFTLKYPSAGDSVLWEHQYNGPGAIDDRSTAIASATDGSITVITGYGKNSNQDEDIYLVKYLSKGTLAWAAEPYNGGRNDFPSAIAVDKDGNIAVTGYTQNSSGLPSDMNNYDFFTAKYNGETGAMIWHDHYKVPDSVDNKAYGIATDASGDIYITGYTTKASGEEDFYTIKYDGTSGNRIWENRYDYKVDNVSVGGNDRAVAIKVDPVIGSNPLDGNIVVLGTVVTAHGDKDIKVIRYSSSGEIRWERTLQRPDINDTAVAMDMDKAGYIYIAGNTGTDLDLDIISLIYDYEGTLLGGTIFNGGIGYDEASAITANHQGEAFIAGTTASANGNLDYVVFKQKNNYILAPSPFLVTTQSLYSQLQLSWNNNTADTSIVIDRTLGPVTDNSVWVNLTTLPYPSTSYMNTGLTAGTQYCYRIEAFKGTLPSRKVITCGVTTLPKPVVTTSSVSTTQLTINWENVTGNTGYKVERKIGAGAWAVHPNGTITANTTSFTDTGLTSGTQYTYRVSTKNSAGYSLPSTDQVVWTLPACPTTPTLSDTWANKVELTWGNVIGETGFRILRKTTGDWETITTVGADILAYTDTTAAANTLYNYSIAPINSSGANTSCTPVSRLTKGSPVLQYAVTKPAPETIRLSWQDASGETAYIVQESYCSSANTNPALCNDNFYGTNNWSNWAEATRLAADTTTVDRTPLTSGYEYRYRIIAEIPGNTTETSNLKGAWAGLSTPLTLTTAPASETSLALSWGDILGESGYEIWRRLGQTGEWTKVATTNFNATTYTDTGLGNQTEYCYQIKAVNNLINADSLSPSPDSSNVSCLPTPLPAPAFGTPTAQSTTQLTVTWNSVAGSNRYELERCQYTVPNDPVNAAGRITNAGYWNNCTLIQVPSPATISYVDSGLTAGYTYRYLIKDYYGTSPEYASAWSSPVIGGTLLAAPPNFTTITSPSGTQMTVNWSDVTGETGYKLGWKPRTGADCSTGTWNTVTVGQNILTYTLSGLTNSTYYCFQIKAVNSWGETDYGSSSTQTTALNAPVQNTPSNITTTSATLSWGNLTDNTGYRIWKKIGTSGEYAMIASVGKDVTSYPDSTLTAGTYYAYKIDALNQGGISALSNEQPFTTTPAKTTLNATAKSTTTTAVTWALRLGATNYKLERKLGVSGEWAEITNLPVPYTQDYCGAPAPTINCLALAPASTTYQDQSLQANSTYYYRVRPWNATGNNGEYSDPDFVTTSSLPSATLTANPVNPFTVKLEWVPETCIGGSCEIPDGYEIEKSNGNNFFSRIATVPAPDNTFTQRTAIDPNTRNTYRVRAYHGFIDSFDKGISTVSWGQHGVVYNVLGEVASDVTVPPINISGVSGIASITATTGGVQLHTTSPNAGHPTLALEKYSYTRLKMLDFTKIHDNFDVQVDFRLPEAPVTATNYHVYGRLHIGFPAGTGANYAYVERSVNSYGANIIINNVSYSAGFATKDTIGKLRISRMGDVISAYAWTGGTWVLIKEVAGFSTATATGANLTQYVQRIEPLSLKIIFDNFEATTQKPAYSNEATAKTPPYVTGANTCQ